QVVTVSFNAAGLDQPGAYTAQLGIKTDTPYPVDPVGVTLNVAAPKSWGKLQGTILGQGCTGAPVPLGAVVRINSLSDPTFGVTLRTNKQGGYVRWLPTGRYDVIVSADTWTPATRRVSVDRGKVTTVNFTLVPVNPCSAVSFD
ncbi:MAG TPA: carboxypeptidase-like regulatory domain-containing protein, partial [Micromonosporaceae bacterium]|nr:carboxypeptidase-like regulatory domain-containing protein [Micromonosporaceae bacterium]